jgi:hypothetical protein
MSGQPEDALHVLRDIWRARDQTDLPDLTGHGKSCKAMRHVGNDPVDEDLRAAWRARLDREGKSRPDGTTVGEMVLGHDEVGR